MRETGGAAAIRKPEELKTVLPFLWLPGCWRTKADNFNDDLKKPSGDSS